MTEKLPHSPCDALWKTIDLDSWKLVMENKRIYNKKIKGIVLD